MVSRTPSRSVARSGSVDSVIWSSGSDDQSRARFPPIAPEPEDTESQAKARGGTAARGPPPSLEERGGRRRTSSRSTKRPTKHKMGKERPHEGSAAKQPGPRRAKRPKQGKAKQVAVKGKAAPLVVCGAQRASLAEVNLGKELPPHSIYMGRSWDFHSNRGGWGNPFKAETCAEQSRAALVQKYREYIGSPSGRWLRYRLHELVGKKCFCHCSLDEVCHVDEVLKVMDDEQKAKSQDNRLPDLGGMSLAEVGLALQSHLLAPRSDPAASVANFVLRHSGLERESLSKDILPFPLSACPTAAEISLSLEAGRTQLGQAEGTKSRHDEYLQQAGLEAWAFLVTWALNFVYSGRHGERAERLETSQSSKHDMNTAQTQALAQLRKYIRGFLAGPTVPQLDWAGELASTKVDYNGEEVKTAQVVTWRQLEPALPPSGKAGCVRAADLLEGWALACMEDPSKTLLPATDTCAKATSVGREPKGLA